MTSPMNQPIEIGRHVTLSVTVTHVRGPWKAPAPSAEHVLAWLSADKIWTMGARAGFTYEVCPEHADPHECADQMADWATYRVVIESVSADVDETS